MNIALDVMGGDHGPAVVVAGAIEAARLYDITILLVGKPELIEAELAQHVTHGLNLPIVPASQVIEMDDKPAKVIRSKPDNSMVVACRLVKEGKAQAFVTAGNTGGALAAGLLHIGRIKGIMRPALVTPFPTNKGFCAVLDVGANADVRPEYMPQFAIMGSIYAEQVLNRINPTVGLLSNGEEEGKGNQLVVSAYELLRAMPALNFIGNIESKEIVAGGCDVVVTDGFTGNIFIKTAEATAKLIQRVMFEELLAGPISKVGTFIAQAGLRRVRARLDDEQFSGAVLLGLSGIMVVAHGRSSANGIRHAIRIAKQGVEHDIPGKIKASIEQLTPSPSTPERTAEKVHEIVS